MLTMILIIAAGMVQQDWYKFEPNGRNFRVELPREPDSTSSRAITNAAGSARLTDAQLIDSDATYTVQVTENPGVVDPNTFDEGIRQFAAEKQAVIGTVAPITVDGNPGRDFEMTGRSEGGQIHSKMRWAVSGKSLFMLMVTGKPGARVPANGDRFLASLEIGRPRVADVAPARVVDAAPDVNPFQETEAHETRPRTAVNSRGKAVVRKSTPPVKVAISRIPRDAKSYPPEGLVDLPRPFVGRDRDGFRDVGPAGSVLVGVRVSYIERFGGPKVRSVQPIYRSGQDYYQGRIYGEVVGPVTTVVAKPDYAIGGLVTHTGLTLDGFGIVFMKVDGDRLDPDDTYNSRWIGDENGGNPGQVASKGGLVVGIQGRSGSEVNGLGLTTLE